MRQRSRYVPLWHSLPGIVVAYQPVRAPNSIAARWNISKNMALVGVYNALDGVAPVWSKATGWTFDGSTQYLSNSYIGVYPLTMLVSMFQTTQDGGCAVMCGDDSAGVGLGVGSNTWDSNGTDVICLNAAKTWADSDVSAPLNQVNVIGAMFTPGFGLAANIFLNGKYLSSPGGNQRNPPLVGTYIGAEADKRFLGFSLRAIAIYSRRLSNDEIWHASRQMLYCDTNADWNAWERQRQWFYASQAAAPPTVTARSQVVIC